MVSLFTAMDINIHQMGSKSGKRSTCKGGKNINNVIKSVNLYTRDCDGKGTSSDVIFGTQVNYTCVPI